MPGSDLALLIDAAREAGQIAKRFHRTDKLDVTYKPHEAGPVTRADLEVNSFLERHLRAARPGYGWLSEESADDGSRLGAKRTFIVDPIDGTRSFIDGSNTWAHALSVVEDGVPVAGVVFLPMRDRLYAAEAGGGARLNDAALGVQDAELAGTEILATKPSLDPKHWTTVPDIKRAHRPSLAYRMALVAEGRYPAMLTFRPSWEWDIAAGALILSEAGAVVTDRAGQALRFNSADRQTAGVIAAAPGLHAALLERSAYAPRPA